MSVKFRKHLFLLSLTSLLLLAGAYIKFLHNNFIGMPDEYRDIDARVPIAVLGDSDSHSYRDKYDNKSRGGKYHEVSFNWLELWARLAGNEISPGRWGVWGSHYRITRVKSMLGLKSRSPKKLDYEYNYSRSGLRCESLLDSWPLQGKWLLNELDSNSAYWKRGLVIIRIGINDFGNPNEILQWSKTGLNKLSLEIVSNCANSIVKTAETILSQLPGIKIAVVGMTRSYNFIADCCQNLPENEIKNIEQVLSEFDNTLKEYASNSPTVAYIDDHFWFNRTFGSLESNNLQKSIPYFESIQLINGSGDNPKFIQLADMHVGTLYNSLWLTNLILELNRQLDFKFSIPRREDVIKIAKLNI